MNGRKSDAKKKKMKKKKEEEVGENEEEWDKTDKGKAEEGGK